MKKENISDALNFINNEIIEKADAARTISKKYKTKRIIRSCVAACLVIAISICSVVIIQKLQPKISPSQNGEQNEELQLPMLTIDEVAAGGDGMGFEGLMAYDISELTNANPWYEDCEITTLPVYKNVLELNENYEPTNINYDKMYDMLYDIAKRLNLNTDKIDATRLDNENIIHYLSYEDNGISITVNADLSASINFDPAIPLPDGYNFNTYATYDETENVARYLKTEYKDVMNYKNPQINIFYGSYSWLQDDSVKQSYNIQFYDKTNDIKQNILNYNFYKTGFYSYYDNVGKLSSIMIYNPDLSEKIGDYPIITADEAKEMLLNGNYVTNVPYQINESKYVKKVELVYKISHLTKTYIPYYRFYVELPEAQRDHISEGLKTYGLYYVPAIESQYISNLPSWNGEFN